MSMSVSKLDNFFHDYFKIYYYVLIRIDREQIVEELKPSIF